MLLPTSILVEKINHYSSTYLFVMGPFATFSLSLASDLKLGIVDSNVFLQTNKRKKLLQFSKQKNFNSSFKKLAKVLTACHSGFKRYLHIRGDIYDFQAADPSSININVGFSYIVNYRFCNVVAINLLRKRVLRTQSKYLATLATSIAQIQNLRPTDPYRGLGIYRRYEKLIYKKRRKQKSSK